MAKCIICGRPATTQVTLRENGATRQVALCDEHYAEAMGGGMSGSPLESLFHGGMMEPFQSFFGGERRSLFGDRAQYQVLQSEGEDVWEWRPLTESNDRGANPVHRVTGAVTWQLPIGRERAT